MVVVSWGPSPPPPSELLFTSVTPADRPAEVDLFGGEKLCSGEDVVDEEEEEMELLLFLN